MPALSKRDTRIFRKLTGGFRRYLSTSYRGCRTARRSPQRPPSTELPGKAAGADDNSYRDDLSYTQRPPIWPPHQDATAVFRSPRLNHTIEFPVLRRCIYVADGKNEPVSVVERTSLTLLTSFGDGGRRPGQLVGVHSIATDSKGNIYTTGNYQGKRPQKFVYKVSGEVQAKQGVPWPKITDD